VPIVRYLARGVSVVLGTDGYGIYETTPALEARTARLFGVSDDDLERMLTTEAAYVARRHARDRDVTDDPAAFVAPPEKPSTHYGPEVPARAARARAARDAALEARLTEIGAVKVELEALERLARRRLVVSIGGAWNASWAATKRRRSRARRSADRALFQKTHAASERAQRRVERPALSYSVSATTIAA